jgi:hypothetical protein
MLVNLRAQASVALVVALLSSTGCGGKNHPDPDPEKKKEVQTIEVETQENSDNLTSRQYGSYLAFTYDDKKEKPLFGAFCDYHWTITDTNNNPLLLDYGQNTRIISVSEMNDQSISTGIIKVTCDVTNDKRQTSRFRKQFTINKQTIQRFIRADAVKTRMACLENNLQAYKTDAELQSQLIKMKLGKEDFEKCFDDINELVVLESQNVDTISKKVAFNKFLMEATIYDKSLCTQEDPNGGLLGAPSALEIKQEKLHLEAQKFANNLAKYHQKLGGESDGRRLKKAYLNVVKVEKEGLEYFLNSKLLVSPPPFDDLPKYCRESLMHKQKYLEYDENDVTSVQRSLDSVKHSEKDASALSSMLTEWDQEARSVKLDKASYLLNLHKIVDIIYKTLSV